MAWRPALLVALLASPAASRFAHQDLGPEEEGCGVSLGLPGLPPGRCSKRIDRRATLPIWNTSLNFKFGQLSKEQLKLLLNAYSAWWGGTGDVPYDTSRQYSLMDFLPPPVQALQGSVFTSEPKAKPAGPEFPYPDDKVVPTYKDSILTPNCWTTGYEVLRFAALRRGGEKPTSTGAPYFVYSTGDQPVIEWLNDATEPVGGPQDALGLPSARQPGDIILVWIDQPGKKRKRLAHFVVLVDPNIIFEKAGSGDTTPYRLTDLSTMHKGWDPTLFKYEVRRPRLGAETTKQPSQRFSIAGTPRSTSLPQFWTWPQEAQRRFALGINDNDDGSIDSITLLEIEEHRLHLDGWRWEIVPAAALRSVPFAGNATRAATIVV